MKTLSSVCIILICSPFALQAQINNTTPTAGGACSVNGKKGTITIEEGNGHVWCKVGNTETECGGTPDKCTYSKTISQIKLIDKNSTPVTKQGRQMGL